MGEENSIAFLIRAHPRNRGSSPLLLGVMATWRFNWIPFERHENLRSPHKFRRVAARMNGYKWVANVRSVEARAVLVHFCAVVRLLWRGGWQRVWFRASSGATRADIVDLFESTVPSLCAAHHAGVGRFAADRSRLPVAGVGLGGGDDDRRHAINAGCGVGYLVPAIYWYGARGYRRAGACQFSPTRFLAIVDRDARHGCGVLADETEAQRVSVRGDHIGGDHPTRNGPIDLDRRVASIL
jgi:hypothetical protein